jgi:hypothetical protein
MTEVLIQDQGCGYHEWGPTEIVTADWIITPTAEVDGQPAVFKQGTMTMRHTCTKPGCGVVETWTV